MLIAPPAQRGRKCLPLNVSLNGDVSHSLISVTSCTLLELAWAIFIGTAARCAELSRYANGELILVESDEAGQALLQSVGECQIVYMLNGVSIVVWWDCTLERTQIYLPVYMVFCDIAQNSYVIVTMKCSICPTPFTWYFHVVTVLTPLTMHNVTKKDVNWRPLSLSTVDCISKFGNQRPIRMLSSFVAVVSTVGTDLDSIR